MNLNRESMYLARTEQDFLGRSTRNQEDTVHKRWNSSLNMFQSHKQSIGLHPKEKNNQQNRSGGVKCKHYTTLDNRNLHCTENIGMSLRMNTFRGNMRYNCSNSLVRMTQMGKVAAVEMGCNTSQGDMVSNNSNSRMKKIPKHKPYNL